MKEFQKTFDYKGNSIAFNFGGDQNMINATQMAKAFPKKRVSDFTSLKQTKEFIGVLQGKTGISVLLVNHGGSTPGTWMHEKLALKFAAWLSADFELWVYERITELLTTGSTTLESSNIVNFNDANTVLKLAQRYADEQNLRKYLERKVDQLAPKAELADKAIEAEGIYTLSQTAKQLKLGYGRNTMCKKLRELGVFFKRTNEPKQDLIKRGLFEIKLHIIERNNHPNKTVSQTFVTGKGLLYISKLLTEKKTG